MGLDMYLTKKFYVQNWDHMKPEERHTISIKQGGKERTDIPLDRIKEITVEVMYWRKANAIHNWFVTNCQEGRDECQETWVSREQLQELLDLCTQVLQVAVLEKGEIVNGQKIENGQFVNITEQGTLIANPEIVSLYLPTSSGFFFGSTEYDAWYLEDIRKTKEMLEEELKTLDGDFYYHASW